jgi:hypothetical protein
MKTKLLLIACSLNSVISFSQVDYAGNISGQYDYAQKLHLQRLIKDMDENLPTNLRYSNNKFADGTLYYINGKRSGLKLNYYLFFGDMRLFENNDTLSIVNDPTLKYVRIGSDFYYHDFKMGYLKIVD